ncbi:MAG: DUF1207 domain-containing protein [Acidobacteria bacterium]|nr:DUF1207 domain-containing protein [Acidobacteriota bacterium]
MRATFATIVILALALGAFAQEAPSVSKNPFDFGTALTFLRMPNDLLWTPPVASQREPHFRLRFTDNDDFKADTAIGAVFPMFRFTPSLGSHEGIQFDIVASVFTRFDEDLKLTASDYLFALPFSWRRGPWEARAGYSHMSSHLGDEYIKDTGAETVSVSRGEVLFGVARRFQHGVRIYGEGFYGAGTRGIPEGKKERWELGLEWVRDHDGLFAALDVEMRANQDHEPNTTAQLGWQWTSGSKRATRIALEYYEGKSPYGQFPDEDEEWIAFEAAFDW